MDTKKQQISFLHGTIEAAIFHATSDTNNCSPFNCTLLGERPAYVSIKLGKTKVAETRHEPDQVWNQSFRILCAHPAGTTVKLTLRTRLSTLGSVQVPAEDLTTEGESKLLPLVTKKGKRNKDVKLYFAIRFKLASECDAEWGLAYGATFPRRSNCGVILYHDAHHRSSFRPPTAGRPTRRLWEDVFKSIDGAKRLIYIAGWSLNPNMALIRDRDTDIPEARGITVGELLKHKAEEGVAVRIMLWNDETSLQFIKNQGVMRTHDEDAAGYFKHTKVVCRLCPRLHHKLPTLFAHHQKTITVDYACDDAEDGSCRHIMSFLGGLDLCDGRYDTEEHSVFRTLNTEEHAHDFYQTSISGSGPHLGGPRQPWHDVHACVVGSAAYDVLANFEQRWSKQCEPSLLVPIDHDRAEHPPTLSWNVRVFRSIDKTSVVTLPANISVESSIHDAYVHAIRRAERFVYIENQYFIGGCRWWSQDQHSGCENLIPVELALKVAAKIKAKERFAVYIVMPMWPEGTPESEPVQDILHWTRLTMETMYKLIADAIRDSGQQANPRDYLNFFCLANREVKEQSEFVPPCSPRRSTHYWKAQNSRRFMIYVHSKLMIVDDEYILIGSANMNQRSMDGERDTEIAIGCYEPKRFKERSQDGGVHAFRASIWYEHTGYADQVFKKPENLECVRRMRDIGEDMWKVYCGEEVVDMGGKHLVSYPIDVEEDGAVQDSVGTFPDTTALIRGRRSKLLPPVCTT